MPLIDRLPECWQRALNPFIEGNEEVQNLLDVLERHLIDGNGNYYPRKRNVFAAFDATHFDNVKVVIVGESPYNDRNATGFAFSSGGVITPSLKNVRKMVRLNNPQCETFPKHGNLEHWAEQGVLLLNRVLTFCDNGNDRNARMSIRWKEFTKIVLEALNNVTGKRIHFVFWGTKAQEGINTDDIRRGRRHRVYITRHPSPKNNLNVGYIQEFLDSRDFQTIDRRLRANAINWIKLPDNHQIMTCNTCPANR